MLGTVLLIWVIEWLEMCILLVQSVDELFEIEARLYQSRELIQILFDEDVDVAHAFEELTSGTCGQNSY